MPLAGLVYFSLIIHVIPRLLVYCTCRVILKAVICSVIFVVEIETVSEFVGILQHLTDIGHSTVTWLGGGYDGSDFIWYQNGMAADHSFTSGGSYPGGTPTNNKIYMSTSSASQATSLGYLNGGGKLITAYAALCEEFPN